MPWDFHVGVDGGVDLPGTLARINETLKPLFMRIASTMNEIDGQRTLGLVRHPDQTP